MLRLDPDVPRHVVAFIIDGTVTAPDMDNLYRAVESATNAKQPVHLYGEIYGVGGLTLGALRSNFKRGFALLPRIGRIDRYAIVTDTNWISTLASLQGAAIPGLEVKTWPTSQREDALAWASVPPAR